MVTIDMALWQLLLKWRLGSFAQLATWQFSKTKLKWRLGRYGAPSFSGCKVDLDHLAKSGGVAGLRPRPAARLSSSGKIYQGT
jgi:hypothetical protein